MREARTWGPGNQGFKVIQAKGGEWVKKELEGILGLGWVRMKLSFVGSLQAPSCFEWVLFTQDSLTWDHSAGGLNLPPFVLWFLAP